MSFVKTEIVETLTAIPTSTASPQPPTPVTPTLIPPTHTPFSTIPFDRHDPESVVRAYFDAWNRNDWATRDALARQKMTYGTVEYVHILEIKNVSPSPTEPIYTVVLEIKPEGYEVTTIRQRFHLSWDAQGDTWYISNFGTQ